MMSNTCQSISQIGGGGGDGVATLGGHPTQPEVAPAPQDADENGNMSPDQQQIVEI